MRLLLFYLTAFILLSIPLVSRATHIVGGEMYYEYRGADLYKITLIVYRDCFKGIPPFDNPAYIAVFDTSWNRIQDLRINAPIPDTIPLENYDSCTWVDTVCYEVATYEIFVTLPPIPGGYKLVYDRCCWNHSVINISNPDERGLSILTAIPDTSVAKMNSSPVFIYRTPTFFCTNKLFEFDHSAVDKDGDSLMYELFTPYNSSRMWDSHLAPLKGPYDPLIYMPGYTLNNVLGSTIPLTIDPFTGFLKARLDNTIGQFVFGVRVKEYRMGKYIGYSERTYQINSQNCQRYTVARFNEPIIQCGDSIVTFSNNSDSSKAYFWHFGDGNTIDSISISTAPTHQYSSTGLFKVMLVAYSYQGKACNDTTFGDVHLYPELEGDFIYEDNKCSNYVQFTDVTNSPSGIVDKWLWNFGDGTGSSTKDPFHEFELSDQPRSYIVTLSIVNENGCTDSIVHIYTGLNRRYDIEDPKASKYVVYPRDDSTLLSIFNKDAVSYLWSPPEGLSSPKSPSTYAYPKERTTYLVRLTDDRGCFDEKTIEIDVFQYSCGESVVYLPNAFSPNGDGENDYLRVRGEEITWLKLSVFNRWGQLVFESTNPGMINDVSLGWDGTFNSVKQDPGVYVYQLEVECSDKRVFQKKGNITLIR